MATQASVNTTGIRKWATPVTSVASILSQEDKLVNCLEKIPDPVGNILDRLDSAALSLESLLLCHAKRLLALVTM